jgi:hypothetical protein
VVLGIEAHWEWAQLTDHQTVSTSVATFNQFTTSARQDIEFFGTARARLGFTPVEPERRAQAHDVSERALGGCLGCGDS